VFWLLILAIALVVTSACDKGTDPTDSNDAGTNEDTSEPTDVLPEIGDADAGDPLEEPPDETRDEPDVTSDPDVAIEADEPLPLPPAPPLLLGTDPNSPASDLRPRVFGEAEDDTNIRLYLGEECEGSPIAEGTAAELASPGIQLASDVPADQVSQFTAVSAVGDLISVCSEAIGYEHFTAPSPVVLDGTDPVSPSQVGTPSVTGSADPGNTVFIYSDEVCEEEALAEGLADVDGRFSVEVTVPENTPVILRARARDPAGHFTPCPIDGLIAYHYDTIAPTLGFFRADALSETTIQANWDQAEDSGSAASAIRYNVCYAEEEGEQICIVALDDPDGWLLAADLGGDAAELLGYQAEDLTEDQRHVFELFAVDEAGNQARQAGPSKTMGIDAGVDLEAGDDHTCALQADGQVWCWGNNNRGQISESDDLTIAVPVPSYQIADPIQVVAGNTHTCALDYTGQAFCWGDNRLGQLGNSTATDDSPPVAVTGLDDGVELASGGTETCLLRQEGAISCWGADYGDEPVAVQLEGADLAGAISIAVSQHTGVDSPRSCALMGDGTSRCWTSENLEAAQLPGTEVSRDLVIRDRDVLLLGSDSQVSSWSTGATATVAVAFDGPVRQVDVGEDLTCAVLVDGRVQCQGLDSDGALGDGTVEDATRGPVFVNAPGTTDQLTEVSEITVGQRHSCALLTDGSSVCWGASDQGQHGSGDEVGEDASKSDPVTAIISNRMAAAWGHRTCGLLASGDIRCWGANSGPRVSDYPSERFISVNPGVHHECSVTVQGTVTCVGSNSEGQLGDGTSDTAATPRDVPDFDEVIEVAAGAAHTCALRADSTVWCWGSNAGNQVGTGATSGAVRSPSVVLDFAGGTPISGIVSLSLGREHSCGLTDEGTVLCWGSNAHGQLGRGDNLPSLTAAPVAGLSEGDLTDVTALYSAPYHICALLTDGQAVCWGRNATAQIDDSGEPRIESPHPIDGFVAPQSMCGGGGHTCAQFADGTVSCRGLNDFGQLGAEGSGPIDVTVSDAAQVVCGDSHTCAVHPDGRMTCWGDNGKGELGVGDRSPRIGPQPVLIYP